MKKYLPQATGFIYLLLFVFCVSTIPVTVKIGLRQQAVPLELIYLRLVIAVTILWLYFLTFKRDALRLDRTGLIGSVQAALASSVSTFAYFFTLSYLDASLTLIVYVTTVIPATMLLLILRGDYPSRLDLFRLVIALIGIYLFIELVGSVSWTGLLLAVVAPFFYAVYITIIQVKLGNYDSQTVTLYVISCMTIIFTIAYFAAGYRWPQFDTVAWATVLWLGIVATAVARMLFFAGVKLAGSRQAALIMPLNTLLGVLWAVLLLNELLTLQQWVGTIFVIISAALGAKAKTNRTRQQTDSTKSADT